eukprot:Tbor_TRINITY_DN2497_c0_g1::TRINITY_DN2497_c0_g1_i1::g.2600::m.2600
MPSSTISSLIPVWLSSCSPDLPLFRSEEDREMYQRSLYPETAISSVMTHLRSQAVALVRQHWNNQTDSDIRRKLGFTEMYQVTTTGEMTSGSTCPTSGQHYLVMMLTECCDQPQGSDAVLRVRAQACVNVPLVSTTVSVHPSEESYYQQMKKRESCYFHYNMATVTFVVVDSSIRGRGVGQTLMLLLEEGLREGQWIAWNSEKQQRTISNDQNNAKMTQWVIRNTIDGMKLQTSDQCGFYERCGYRPGRTAQLVSERKCFSSVGMQQDQLDRLSALFGKREKTTGGYPIGDHIMDNRSSLSSVTHLYSLLWMYKLLREEMTTPFVALPFYRNLVDKRSRESSQVGKDSMQLSQISIEHIPCHSGLIVTEKARDIIGIDKMDITLAEYVFLFDAPTNGLNNNDRIECDYSTAIVLFGLTTSLDTDATDNSVSRCHLQSPLAPIFFSLQVPWQRQLGPSCGLSILRMVRELVLSIMSKTFDDDGRNEFKMVYRDKIKSVSLMDIYLNVILKGEQSKIIDKDNNNHHPLTSMGEVLSCEALGEIAVSYLNKIFGCDAELVLSRKEGGGIASVSAEVAVIPPDNLTSLSPIIKGQRFDIINNTMRKSNRSINENNQNSISLSIVPYDREGDECPSAGLQGARAHWGLVVGGILPCYSSQVLPSYKDTSEHLNAANDVLLLQHGSGGDVVLCTQGELIASNSQLINVPISCDNIIKQVDLRNGPQGLCGHYVKLTIAL